MMEKVRATVHGITYEIKCQGCGDKYIGETATNAYTRGTEHADRLDRRDERSVNRDTV